MSWIIKIFKTNCFKYLLDNNNTVELVLGNCIIYLVGCSEKHFLLKFSFISNLILVWFNLGNEDPVLKK